jgi:DNA repair protein SbcD/Mre11
MKILHTSDWHLGQKFLYHDRQAEHQTALDWLARTIDEHRVDALIVAGDIFDIGNPPNYARRQYYRFLTGLLNSCCRHVVITGGNHDSPAMLNAPRELLQALNMHVVGAASENIEDEIIELKDENGKLECVVAAAPFLRDRDLRYSVAGEGNSERSERIREGIRNHYMELGRLAERYGNDNAPIIATGHLYATGAEASDRQDNIYIGNMENIEARHFPEVFDYVALGHIHRAQAVGGLEHVRYSGSLIPLSFSEVKDEKSVYVVEFEGRKIGKINTVAAPAFRRLKTIQGTLDEVKEGLKRFAKKKDRMLTPWVEVIVETDKMIPRLDIQLKEFTSDMDLELLRIRLDRRHFALDAQAEEHDLDDLDVIDVFKKKCSSNGSPPEEMEELLKSFLELRDWMNENSEE